VADPWGERMPRSVSLLQTVGVSVGITIGSGIFRVPATVAAQLQTPGMMLACWVLGGIVALCGALTIAELAGSLPRSGGIFAYLLESYGPLAAFLFGWTELIVIRAAALGAIATIFAEYLGYFLPLTAGQVRDTAAAAIVLVGVINYIGVQRAARVLAAATALKYAVLLGVGLLAFTVSGASAGHLKSTGPAPVPISVLATALIPVMWTYDGWADATAVAGEISNPQRNLPLALIAGAACIMLVYLIVNVGFLHALTPGEMAGTKLVAASVAARIPLLHGGGAALIAAAVVISTFSSLHASMLTGSRIFFAMGDRDLLFRIVARVSPRFSTPSVAILLATALGVVYVLQNDFAQLAGKFILGIWPFYALTVAAVFVLRRRLPALPRPYRVWGYPLVPLVFLAASAFMVLNALLTNPHDTGITFAIILTGVPVFWLRALHAARADRA
jgi:basic amino acid/polyamine antiporter, APA family